MAKAAPRVRMRPRGAAPCVPGPSRSNHSRINGRFGTCENGQTIRSASLHRVASAAISALPLPDSRTGMATDGLSSPNQGKWSNILVAALGNGVDSYRRPIACDVLNRAQCRQSFLAFLDATGPNRPGAFLSSRDGQSGAFQESPGVPKHVV